MDLWRSRALQLGGEGLTVYRSEDEWRLDLAGGEVLGKVSRRLLLRGTEVEDMDLGELHRVEVAYALGAAASWTPQASALAVITSTAPGTSSGVSISAYWSPGTRAARASTRGRIVP